MDKIEEIIEGRRKTHGDILDNARVTERIFSLVTLGIKDNNSLINFITYMIVGKIARMLNGDFLFDDNLLDTIGYSKVALATLRKGEMDGLFTKDLRDKVRILRERDLLLEILEDTNNFNNITEEQQKMVIGIILAIRLTYDSSLPIKELEILIVKAETLLENIKGE